MEAKGKSTVLVVDDEPAIRWIAADMFVDLGYAVVEADNAASALVVLSSHKEVNVLFTDINMPGAMDGLQLARYVATYRPDIKVIVTSGRFHLSPEDLPEQSIFLPKPYASETLGRVLVQ